MIETEASFMDSLGVTEAEMAEIRAEIKIRHAREVPYRCAWGRCMNYYDPVDGRISWGWGATGCPCDNLPGWNGRHPEMLPKPAWPGKAVGRNGSRVQRSRRRHRSVGKSGYMRWAEDFDGGLDQSHGSDEGAAAGVSEPRADEA